MASKLPFSKGDYVVYPTHGVGKVMGVEKQEIAGFQLQLFVISFDSEKMTLRVPVEKVKDSGLRKISSRDKMASAVTTLRGRARAKRTMWSRRAQEYEAKINSGDPVSIAEVVRDLHRATGQPDQSYSERQMYEAATRIRAVPIGEIKRVLVDLLLHSAARGEAHFGRIRCHYRAAEFHEVSGLMPHQRESFIKHFSLHGKYRDL